MKREIKVALSVIGILLAMIAGGLSVLYLQAENKGWITVPYLKISDDEWMDDPIENIWLMVCTKNIPYWQGTIEDANEYGYFVSSCNVLITLWSD